MQASWLWGFDQFISDITTTKGGSMTELKMNTTLYFKVPLGEKPEEYMEELLSLDKVDLLARATDYGDGELELN